MKLVLSALLVILASTADAAGCREGERVLFFETSPDAQSTIWNHAVCRNGAFAPMPKVKHRPCVEGHTEMVLEHKGSQTIPTWRTCRNGSYYPPVVPPKILKCREGRIEIFLEGVSHTKPIHYVCRNGVFKKLY